MTFTILSRPRDSSQTALSVFDTFHTPEYRAQIFHKLQLYNNGSTSFSYNNAASLWLITSAVVDVAISAALTITLRQRVGIVKEVDSLLRRLMIVGLHTAAYTAIPAVTGGEQIASNRDVIGADTISF
jgi:hypothetical protein